MRAISLAFLTAAGLLATALSAHATINVRVVPQGSRLVKTDTASTIFAGSVSGATCPEPTGLCNSCDGTRTSSGTAADGFKACNYNGVTYQTIATFEGDSDAIGQNTMAVLRCTPSTGSSTAAPVSLNVGTVNGNTLVATTTWGSICAACGAGSTCTSSFTGTLSFGAGVNQTDNPTEKADLSVVFSVVSDSDSLSTPCKGDADDPVDGVDGDGYCEFTTYPGDGKVYAEKLSLAGQKITTAGGVKYNGLVFFHAEADQFATDAQALQSITNASASTTVEYDNATVPPEVDSRILGLENDKKYCFIMANRDEAGNISKGTKISGYPVGNSNPTTTAALCATPSEVIGLLDDKKCFIATAAFGSPFEPHVQKLRQFRDVYLKSNAAGRAFVEFYYSVSPPIAHWIKDKPLVKTAVRGALWPLYAAAEIMIRFGALETLIVALGLIAVTYSLRRRALARKVQR